MTLRKKCWNRWATGFPAMATLYIRRKLLLSRKSLQKGYRLKAKYIIHTVGPIYSGTAEDAAQLADCYRNSLDLAKEYELHSIAFPAISTGVYGYPLEDATEIAVKTVAQWLEAHADYAMQVIFCCFDARTERVYQARTLQQ